MPEIAGFSSFSPAAYSAARRGRVADLNRVTVIPAYIGEKEGRNSWNLQE